MFEKEADEIAKDYAEHNQGKYTNEFGNLYHAYLAGAEFGYNKANEWHKVADGDLPKNNTVVLAILKNKRVKISTFMENKFTIWNNDYDAYTKLYDVIAWCEIPKFEE